MTAIAIKDGVLAVDSQITHSSALRYRADKAFTHKNWVIAGSGSLADIQRHYRIFSKLSNGYGAHIDSDVIIKAEWPALADPDGLVVAYNGREIIEFWGDMPPVYVKSQGRSLCQGYGCHSFLMGAMLSGQSAQDAVILACKHVTGVGGPVKVFFYEKGFLSSKTEHSHDD